MTRRWKLVEYKKVSEERPTEKLGELTQKRDKMNDVTEGEGLLYMVEKVEDNDVRHQDDDHCDCGGILNPDVEDEDEIMRYKCEDCGKIYYNEHDL